MRPAIIDAVGKSRAPRAAFYEIASLDLALQSTRSAMLEDITAIRLACSLQGDFDDQLAAYLQSALERVTALCRQCMDIHRRRQELIQEHDLASGV